MKKVILSCFIVFIVSQHFYSFSSCLVIRRIFLSNCVDVSGFTVAEARLHGRSLDVHHSLQEPISIASGCLIIIIVTVAIWGQSTVDNSSSMTV